MPCKSRAVDIVTALIQRHDDGFGWDSGKDRRCFLPHPGGGVACAAFGNFSDFETAKPELAPDVIEPLAIMVAQFPLRAPFQPAD